jgi:8-oxo-dGTP diphosphatase
MKPTHGTFPEYDSQAVGQSRADEDAPPTQVAPGPQTGRQAELPIVRHHEMPVGVLVILSNPAGRVLMLRRGNVRFAPGHWTLPGGHVERNESLAEACAREIGEELGVRIPVNALTPVLLQHKRDVDQAERIEVFFETTMPTTARPSIREPHAHDAMTWADPHDLPSPVVPNVLAALVHLSAPDESWLSYFGFTE